MDASLQSLVGRLEGLSDQFDELRVGVQKAIRIADADPEMALTRARKVLEYVIRDVYERRINEPPGTRPLENLLQRLVRDGYFPNRLDAYASAIRKLGNVGTHSFGERIAVADVYQSLTQLMAILEWYFEVERPEALHGQVATRPSREHVESWSIRKNTFDPAHITVVPKGLRSFDAHDADFFLDLLPGPRDKDGLPESIRFWKHRIEPRDEATFTVGVLYGPSGCGKSSLVKAGLAPKLSDQILSVLVEATSDETEGRLLQGLRRGCPELPDNLGLVETLQELRHGRGLAAGKKVLIVLDQFEQWLHAHGNEQESELAQALRQCDGDHVQCIVIVRDDFSLPLLRFLNELQIELLQGQNMAVVDLFDPVHARNVLVSFGRAFQQLGRDITKDQSRFLDQAIQGLARDGRIIPIRLALFAEMVKGKPWLPVTLQQVGGAEGIGATFLEETFGPRSVSSLHRQHEAAARRVLKALLPEAGTDIKGHMRSHQELLEASGYEGRPREFNALLRILDTELRLITPTSPESPQSDLASNPASKYFQLTHDYLVPSLREWLTLKQKETRRGRAELLLADRAALWNDKPENRHLPSLAEYISILLLTRRQNWTHSQRAMLQKCGRVRGLRAALAAGLLLAMFFGGRELYGRIKARSLVDQLVSADIAQVPNIVEKLADYRGWADPLLKQEVAQAKQGSSQQLHLKLALLPVDESQAADLRGQLLVVTPSQFPIVREALLPYVRSLLAPLWEATANPSSSLSTEQRFQAACALAYYSSTGPEWRQIDSFVANHLVTLQASEFLAWKEALRSAKAQLIRPLGSIYRDKTQKELSRTYATETLVDYASDDPTLLFDLLADAEQFQFPIVYSKLKSQQQMVTLAQQELEKLPEKSASEIEKEALAQRQANAAVALYLNGMPEKVWPLLKFRPDPRVRSYVIHWLGPLGVDPRPIIERFDQESDVTIRRALLLALGEFEERQLASDEVRNALSDTLLVHYEKEPDPGLHAAAEWLLRTWGAHDRVEAAIERLKTNEVQLQAQRANDNKRWYVDTQGQTFVLLDAGEFLMGSPKSEPDRQPDEPRHRRRIGRRYAIAMTDVTKAQYERFRKDRPETDSNVDQWVKTEDSPQTGMTWYEAAWYCNWLSQQEGIPKEEWCFEPSNDGKYGPEMRVKDKYLDLHGYRLPTEAEWENACRAGTMTSRYYGFTDTLLPKYAWYLANGDVRTWPVARLKPNDFGLFDMHGNAWQWCFDVNSAYPDQPDELVDDSPTTESVREDGFRFRMFRGGAFDDKPSNVRSAHRAMDRPAVRNPAVGFRLARTYP